MANAAHSEPIDTGAAPTIYCDDLGKIVIKQNTVCWYGVEEAGDHTFVAVKIITPISAVPSIAAQFVAAFGHMVSRRVAEKMRQIAGYVMH